MALSTFPRVAGLKNAAMLRAHLERSGIRLGFDDELQPGSTSALASSIDVNGARVGNRFCILPMEGWDGTRDGQPGDLTRRRWRRFGEGGAKLIWGGEAVAVRHDGRGSPNQLLMNARNQKAIAGLHEELRQAHRTRFGSNADTDLYVGLQLTHSGRFARPNDPNRPEPLAAASHPILDSRVPSGVPVLTDDQLDKLVQDFIAAARLAHGAGFQFVDVKLCHGYLGHELIGAHHRAGRYGGSLENRFRWARQIIEGIREAVPGLEIGVRLSAFDVGPYRKGPNAVGVREEGPAGAPSVGFGLLTDDDLSAALQDARLLVGMLRSIGVRLICVTAGSPYYSPHVQRPAFFPPADGYQPPEDPLRGVARQVVAAAQLKAWFPDVVFVGSAYSYLQEWLPHVAQYNVRNGLVDFVGLGRLALCYPDLPADVLEDRPLRRTALCRTFSDCTTGPRLGFVSGCYPLDSHYKAMPQAGRVLSVRTGVSAGDES